MRRWASIFGRSVRWVLGTIMVIALLLVALGETVPGLSILAWLIPPLTGGQVSVHGLSGHFPHDLRADTVDIKDTRGIWLHIEHVTLDWSALAALDKHLVVRRVTAERLVLLRKPLSKRSQGATPPLDINRLSIARMVIAPSVFGQPATLTATGTLHYRPHRQLRADLTVLRLNSNDRYQIKGSIARDVVNGTMAIHEGADGILAGLIGLPGLRPINLKAHMAGDRTANVLSFDLTADTLHAWGQGTVALATHRMDLDVSVRAPAMQPRADMAWRSLGLEGHIHGPFDTPDVKATLQVGEVKVAGVEIARFTADVAGQKGALDLRGTAAQVRLPGPYPRLLAPAPVTLAAHVSLGGPTRTATFSLSHFLMAIKGKAEMQGKTTTLSAQVTVPSLKPFAALEHADLPGSATLRVDAKQSDQQTAVALQGKIRTEGPSLIARLLGRDAALSLQGTVTGTHLLNSKMTLHGAGLSANVTGNFRERRLHYAVSLALTDLSRLTTRLTGTLALSGSVTGPLQHVSFQGAGNAKLALPKLGWQRITLRVQASGFPTRPVASVRAEGRLDGARLVAVGNWAALGNGKLQTARLAVNWKSFDAQADLALPQAGPITGSANLDLKRLADLSPFLGSPVMGNVKVALRVKAQGTRSLATLHAQGTGLGVADVQIGAFSADGAVDGPLTTRLLALHMTTSRIALSGFSGTAEARLNGPLDRLAIALKAELRDSSANPASLAASALLNIPEREVTLQHADIAWRHHSARLQHPATVYLANGMSVDHLAVKVGGGEVSMSGRVSPKLAVSLSAQGVQASILQIVLPHTSAMGTLNATVRLSGTLHAPQGTFFLQGRGLRAHDYSTITAAPAQLDAHGTWRDKTVALNATLSAGKPVHLTVSGEVSLQGGGSLNLQATGTADLALLNPLLLANGRQVRGLLALNAHVGGTLVTPNITGNGKLTNGEFQDYSLGTRLRAISATLDAHGHTIQISQFGGHAGSGTINGQGAIDLSTSGMRVNLSLQAHDAQPVVSDRLTVVINGAVKLAGQLGGTLHLTGQIDILRGDLNLPDKFPPQVAILDVRRRGQTAPVVPPSPSTIITFDLTVSASGQIFIRGHGIDATMGGKVHLTGTNDAPLVSGGFEMERGTLSLAGQTLDFTTGKISFDGTGVKNRLDPTLDFVAQTTSGGVTATLTVSGYASAPKITLSSSPPLPQDEILAHLFFQQSTKQLTPLQLAQIAQALASFGGVGSGFDPLGALRKKLGLDRLAVGSTSNGASGSDTQTTIEAGKYVARNVYVGAKQNLSSGTQVQVQVDITKQLKAQATLSTITNATVTESTPTQDTGSSVGLSYQFEY